MNAVQWSIRRELWEHGWIYRVPLIIGIAMIVVMAGVAEVHVVNAGEWTAESRLLTARVLSGVFDLGSRMIIIVGTLTSYVYCSEAMHGERRERSILFWKSWPVSDGATVAAKAMVAMVLI